MTTETVYRSDTRPDFAPFEEELGSIKGFQYAGDLASEVAAGTLDKAGALGLLDDMLAIREMEEMIVRLRSGGGYDPLPGYDYRGPTHVSIGQEASAVGASSVLRITDNVTSSPPRPRRRDREGLLRAAPDDRRAARARTAAAATGPATRCWTPPSRSTSTR